jgi:hypothetical protein
LKTTISQQYSALIVTQKRKRVVVNCVQQSEKPDDVLRVTAQIR